MSMGMGIKTTEALLIFLLKKKTIDFNQFKEKINYYNKIKMLKPEIFQFIIKEAEKYK